MQESLLLIDEISPRAVVEGLVRVGRVHGGLAWMRVDAGVAVVVIHDILGLLLVVSFREEEKPSTAPAGQQNQNNHGTNNRRAAIATCAILDVGIREAVDAHEADVETKLGFRLLQPTLHR
jgi:hypothetical protein